MKTRSDYTHIEQLPEDPEVWGDAEYAFYWAEEARKVGEKDLKARKAVVQMLQQAGEPVTPISWTFLIPLLAERLGVDVPELNEGQESADKAPRITKE